MNDQQTEGEGMTRLSFLKTSAGAVAGAAAISVPKYRGMRTHA